MVTRISLKRSHTDMNRLALDAVCFCTEPSHLMRKNERTRCWHLGEQSTLYKQSNGLTYLPTSRPASQPTGFHRFSLWIYANPPQFRASKRVTNASGPSHYRRMADADFRETTIKLDRLAWVTKAIQGGYDTNKWGRGQGCWAPYLPTDSHGTSTYDMHMYIFVHICTFVEQK